ncbi:MAG: hypothetical protein ACM3PZ_02830 [Bacillota bacterium]
MKKKTIFALTLAILSIGFASFTLGKTKSYYSGDAIAFDGRLYVATANTGSLEVFQLNGSSLNRIAKVKARDERFNTEQAYSDALLRVEDGSLVVYATSGRKIDRYSVNGSSISLDDSIVNTYWEWYNQLDEIDGKLITLSERGIKVWNEDMQIIDEHAYTNVVTPYNLQGAGKKVYNIQDGSLRVYDLATRQVQLTIPLNYRIDPSAHKSYIDANGNIFAVDDYYAKKFSPNGKLLASFRHLDHEGYDLSASGHSGFVYFSDGVGVVKLDADTMEAVDWEWTGGISGSQGWAMGLKVVNLDGDKLVLFNNSNISVLDSSLKKIASFRADEEEEPAPKDSLYLNVDKNRGAVNSEVLVTGGGFVPDEPLELTLGSKKLNLVADYRGRFSQKVTVPGERPGGYDIKLVGQKSKLSYSIAFYIE